MLVGDKATKPHELSQPSNWGKCRQHPSILKGDGYIVYSSSLNKLSPVSSITLSLKRLANKSGLNLERKSLAPTFSP